LRRFIEYRGNEMCQIRGKKFFLLILGCIFALVCLASATVLVGRYHWLTHIMLDSSGGKIASSSSQCRSSIGQRFVGEAKSALYRNLSGYIRLSEDATIGEGLRVVSTLPEDDGYFIIWQDTDIKIIFNKEMSSSTVVPENIQVKDEYGEELPLTGPEIDYADSVITITPSQKQMKYCARYTIKVSTNVTDVYGNSLIKPESFSFTTLIPGELTTAVAVEHKEGIVKIDNPSETFPQGSKGWYIKLIEADSPSLSNYVEGTGRILKCYKVDDSDNPKDINQLDRPVAISVPYPSDTKDRKNLKIYFYNKDIDRWELVKGSGDTNPDDNSVTGQVSITNTEYCVRGFVAGDVIENYCNYPNPFKAGKEETTIIYDLVEDAKVTISIYDLLGQLVRRIEIPKGTPGKGEGGTNEVSWDGKNERGRVVANGGYYCVVEADTETGKHMKKTRKIMVIK